METKAKLNVISLNVRGVGLLKQTSWDIFMA